MVRLPEEALEVDAKEDMEVAEVYPEYSDEERAASVGSAAEGSTAWMVVDELKLRDCGGTSCT